MKRAVIFLAGALVGGFGLGWISAPRAEAPDEARAYILPALSHGGADAEAARTRLSALGFTVATAPDETFEAPPPPDIALLFRRDLTAIDLSAARPRVWIVDFTQSFGRRALAVGDVYQDGWRVGAIAPQSIELRRRRETRRVAVFDLPPQSEQ